MNHLFNPLFISESRSHCVSRSSCIHFPGQGLQVCTTTLKQKFKIGKVSMKANRIARLHLMRQFFLSRYFYLHVSAQWPDLNWISTEVLNQVISPPSPCTLLRHLALFLEKEISVPILSKYKKDEFSRVGKTLLLLLLLAFVLVFFLVGITHSDQKQPKGGRG